MRAYQIMFRKAPFYLLVLVALMLQACFKAQETDLERQKKADDEALHSYFKTQTFKGQSLDSAVIPAIGGYYYVKDSAIAGNQAVKSNDILAIHYKVTSLDGLDIEDSLNRGNLTKLRVLTQAGSLLPIGLDAGLGLMRKGETYLFYIPSTLAFGDYSSTTLNFPAHSNLIIKVRIDSILTDAQQKGIEGDAIHKYLSDNKITDFQAFPSGLYYQKTQDGTGTTLPASGNTVTLNYTGKYLDGTVFDQSNTTPFSFAIGGNKVIKGFEEGIKKMHKGEKGRIILPSSLAYDASLQVIPQKIRPDLVKKNFIANPADRLKPFSVLVFEIEILDIQ